MRTPTIGKGHLVGTLPVARLAQYMVKRVSAACLLEKILGAPQKFRMKPKSFKVLRIKFRENFKQIIRPIF